MREILFRGKRLDNGEWVYGSLHIEWGETDRNGNRSLDYRVLGMRGECDYIDPTTVGQYTGRTDKNKRRVFEGDIIRLCNGIPGFDIGAILWDDNDQAYLIVTDIAEKVMLDDFGNYGRPEYYEVIGNIHDNPELMRGDGDG